MDLVQLQGIDSSFNVVNIGTFETVLDAKKHELALRKKGKHAFKMFAYRKVVGNVANNGTVSKNLYRGLF